jgi:hypothetical protein
MLEKLSRLRPHIDPTANPVERRLDVGAADCKVRASRKASDKFDTNAPKIS